MLSQGDTVPTDDGQALYCAPVLPRPHGRKADHNWRQRVSNICRGSNRPIGTGQHWLMAAATAKHRVSTGIWWQTLGSQFLPLASAGYHWIFFCLLSTGFHWNLSNHTGLQWKCSVPDPPNSIRFQWLSVYLNGSHRCMSSSAPLISTGIHWSSLEDNGNQRTKVPVESDQSIKLHPLNLK
jgi:hypothetical protein